MRGSHHETAPQRLVVVRTCRQLDCEGTHIAEAWSMWRLACVYVLGETVVVVVFDVAHDCGHGVVWDCRHPNYKCVTCHACVVAG